MNKDQVHDEMRVIYKGPGCEHGKLGFVRVFDTYSAVYWDSGSNSSKLEDVIQYLFPVIQFDVLSKVKEIDCKHCSKTNDAGVKCCWWCGNEP